jgi:NADP-dependent 3-hydroxy acid dehydrogenase YdfG
VVDLVGPGGERGAEVGRRLDVRRHPEPRPVRAAHDLGEERRVQPLPAEEGRVAAPGTLMRPDDVAAIILAALLLPKSAEVTDITLRPMRLL